MSLYPLEDDEISLEYLLKRWKVNNTFPKLSEKEILDLIRSYQYQVSPFIYYPPDETREIYKYSETLPGGEKYKYLNAEKETLNKYDWIKCEITRIDSFELTEGSVKANLFFYDGDKFETINMHNIEGGQWRQIDSSRSYKFPLIFHRHFIKTALFNGFDKHISRPAFKYESDYYGRIDHIYTEGTYQLTKRRKELFIKRDSSQIFFTKSDAKALETGRFKKENDRTLSKKRTRKSGRPHKPIAEMQAKIDEVEKILKENPTMKKPQACKEANIIPRTYDRYIKKLN